MHDFFISYTAADQKWAEWIAYQLEEANYKTIIQAWDFRPGNNFALEMQKAAKAAPRTLVVLSPNYLQSKFGASEWAAAFAKDPEGTARSLIPVRIAPCELAGLQKTIIHIDLVGLDVAAARDALLRGVQEGRAKPGQAPAFPGIDVTSPPTASPVEVAMPRESTTSPYRPKVRRAPTDADKRRYLKSAFETIREHFHAGLTQLEQDHDHIETDFQPVTATEFRAEIFLEGRSVSCLRYWQGSIFGGEGISVSDGNSHGHNSCNESLSVEVDEAGDLYLRAMNADYGLAGPERKRMSPEEAADYLWRRILEPLEWRR